MAYDDMDAISPVNNECKTVNNEGLKGTIFKFGDKKMAFWFRLPKENLF